MLDRISVVVVTKNAAEMLRHCLMALSDFYHVVVADSNSEDESVTIAESLGIPVEDFTWNGQYPKKRQWCLDHLEELREYVFFIDADEIVTAELVAEIKSLGGDKAGYFVQGQYMFENKLLRHGMRNNKLCLISHSEIQFPVVDDLDIKGMGEIEGHYQPVLKQKKRDEFGTLKAPLIHYAYDVNWDERHQRYACWQAAVEARKALPGDVTLIRKTLKIIFSIAALRPAMAFLHSYIFKMGFLDGGAGYRFALSRYRYYRMINANREKGRSA